MNPNPHEENGIIRQEKRTCSTQKGEGGKDLDLSPKCRSFTTSAIFWTDAPGNCCNKGIDPRKSRTANPKTKLSIESSLHLTIKKKFRLPWDPSYNTINPRKEGREEGLQRKTESLCEMRKWEKEKYACVQLTDLLLSLPSLQPFLPAATSSPTIHKNSDLDLLSCVSLSILFIRATRQQQQQPRKKKKDSSLAYAGRGLCNVSVHTWTKRTPRCKINYPHSHFWPKPNSLWGSLKLKTEYQMETHLDWAQIKEQCLFIFDVWKWSRAFMYRVRNR